MKLLYSIIAVSLLVASQCFATTWVSNGTSADVQAKVNSSVDGDTVTLPAGTFPYTSGVTITKQITLQGAGTSATGGGDQTTIVDNIGANQQVLNFNNSTNTLTVRMTGITVRSGTGSIKDGGTCTFGGPMNLRIDHCHFVASSVNNYRIVNLNSSVFGVMDHCVLDLTGTNAVYISNGRRGPPVGDVQANREWTLPTNFGSSDYFFIEDNIINGDVGGGPYSTRVYDGFTGAKVVLRFNRVSQATMGETHATGHSPDDRGLRSQEVYGNAVTSSLQRDPNFVALDMGSGTTVVWGNTWNNVYKNIYHFNVTRKNNNTYNQTATPNGWGYAGTQFNGTGSNWDGGTLNGTDTLRGYPCIDMPGRAQGDLLIGEFPNKTNQTTGTIRWPNQALEPIYMWNNPGSFVSGWGGSDYANDTGGRVVANRDYYPSASGIQTSPTSPFDGSSGTGWGTLANRPTTCTTGVGYFATNQGSWNTSSSNPYGVQQSGADGVLYKCTATNTWTLYYTPYTYPHPLASGGPTPTPTPTPTPGGPSPTATATATATATPTAIPSPTPCVGFKAIPRGAYELMQGTLDGGVLTGYGALNNASIDGIRLKIQWATLEPSPGVYNWTNLDDAISKTLATGKKAGLGIGTGLGAPSWLYDSTLPVPVVGYTLQDGENAGSVIHQPGDPIFLARLTSFINAVAARYDSNPTVSYVTIEGNARHSEWNIAPEALDTAALGGTQAKVNIWIQDTKNIIDIYMNAFQTTTGLVSLQRPFNNSMGWPAMYTASNYGVATWKNHFGLSFSGLNANSSTSYDPANQIFLNFSACPTWAQFGQSGGGPDGVPLSEGVDQALRSANALKIRGVEIYKPDCDNSSIYSYTAPSGSMWQGNNVSGTAAGITVRRNDLLVIPGITCPSPTPTPTPVCVAPAAPSGFSCTVIGQTQINLAWTDNSNNETGFQIDRGSPNCNSTLSIAVLGANVTTYNNQGLNPGTTYCYYVRSYRDCAGSPRAYSAPSNTCTKSTLAPTPTATATATATATVTATATATVTATVTATATATATAVALTPTPTATVGASPTATFTPIPTATFTPTPTVTATATATATATYTPTPPPTPSPTPTPGGMPNPPKNVHTTSQSGTGTFLTWDLNATSEGVVVYHVYRYKGNSNNAELVSSPTVPPQDIVNFLGGNRTTFAVSAVNSAGEGNLSDKHTVQKQ